MPKYIAILRGINVGGHRKILMGDLREMFRKMGFNNIQTYIQSGNVIFESPNKVDKVKLRDSIKEQILSTFGLDVPVILRAAKEIGQAITNNPFLKEGTTTEGLFLTFLQETPGSENIKNAKSYNFSPDRFEIEGKHVFGFCAGKYHESKLSNTFFENKLKVSATTRNWKTVRKLFELASSD